MGTVSNYKSIIKEGWSKNMEALCAAMKLNKIQKDILTDYMNNGQIKSQYIGRAAGSSKQTRIYAAKKKYTGQLSDKKEALYSAMKLNAKQKNILATYIRSGKIMGKYSGSMAGSTKETQRYAGMRAFKEYYEGENA